LRIVLWCQSHSFVAKADMSPCLQSVPKRATQSRKYAFMILEESPSNYTSHNYFKTIFRLG